MRKGMKFKETGYIPFTNVITGKRGNINIVTCYNRFNEEINKYEMSDKQIKAMIVNGIWTIAE